MPIRPRDVVHCWGSARVSPKCPPLTCHWGTEIVTVFLSLKYPCLRAGGGRREGIRRTEQDPRNNSRTSCALLSTQFHPSSPDPTRDDSRPGVGAKLPGQRGLGRGGLATRCGFLRESSRSIAKVFRVGGGGVMWPRETDRDRGLAAACQARVPAINNHAERAWRLWTPRFSKGHGSV